MSDARLGEAPPSGGCASRSDVVAAHTPLRPAAPHAASFARVSRGEELDTVSGASGTSGGREGARRMAPTRPSTREA